MSKEAMRLALDWFKCYKDGSMSRNNADALADEFVEALEEALAKQELLFEVDGEMLTLNQIAGVELFNFQEATGCDTAEEFKATQEQGSTTCDKPVALETVYETIIDWDEGGGKRSRRELARRIEALYTTPRGCNDKG